MPTLIERRQSLDAKNAKLKEMLAAGNDLTAEETKRAGDLQAEIKQDLATLQLHIAQNETDEEVKRFLSEPAKPFQIGGTQEGTREEAEIREGRAEAIKGFTAAQWNAISTKSYRDAWHVYLAKGVHGLKSDELKVLQEGIDANGGFLVPDQIQNELLMRKPTPTPIQDRVRRYQTGRDSLTIPKMVWTDDLYTSGVRMTKTGEVPASSTTAAQTDPILGNVRIEIYTEMVSGQITRDLLEDSLFPVDQMIAEQYGFAKAIKMDNKILNGTGSGEQVGILSNPGGTTGNEPQPAVVNMGSPITADGLVKLLMTMPIQYEDNAVWIFNKTNTQAGIALLKDTQNRYMFAYGSQDDKLAGGLPTTLLGSPIVRSALMPNAYAADLVTANANAFPVIYADLSGYAVIERVGLSIQVLDQTQAKLNQIELVGRWRWGGAPVEEYKIKVGKVA